MVGTCSHKTCSFIFAAHIYLRFLWNTTTRLPNAPTKMAKRHSILFWNFGWMLEYTHKYTNTFSNEMQVLSNELHRQGKWNTGISRGCLFVYLLCINQCLYLYIYGNRKICYGILFCSILSAFLTSVVRHRPSQEFPKSFSFSAFCYQWIWGS